MLEENKQKEIDELLKAQRETITNFALQGGGAKGTAYTGVYEAMCKMKLIDDLEILSGASAGALQATMIACGVEFNLLKDKLGEKSFKKLLGKGKKRWFGLFQKDGKPIYDLLHNSIKNSFSKFINNEQQWTEKEQQNFANLSPEDKNEFDGLKAKLATTETKFYFKDLSLLKKISPKNFKDLIVVADKQTDHSIKVFSTEETPNIEIALAALASAALPVILKPVEIDGVKYIDGGVLNNLPIEYFAVGDKRGNTLAVGFNEQNKIYNVTHKGDENPFKFAIFQRFINWILRLFGILPPKSYEETKNEDLKKFGEKTLSYGHRGIANNNIIGTKEFDKAFKLKDECHLTGYFDTIQYCMNYGVGETPTLEQKQTFEVQKFFFDVLISSQLSPKDAAYKQILELCKKEIFGADTLNTQETFKEFHQICKGIENNGFQKHLAKCAKDLYKTTAAVKYLFQQASAEPAQVEKRQSQKQGQQWSEYNKQSQKTQQLVPSL